MAFLMRMADTIERTAMESMRKKMMTLLMNKKLNFYTDLRENVYLFLL